MRPADPSEASARLDAAVRSADWVTACDMLDEEWVELLQDSPSALLNALDRIPRAELERRPRLLLSREYVARSLGRDDHSSAYRMVRAATAPRDDRDRLATLTVQIAAARSAGRGRESVRLVAEAHAILEARPTIGDLASLLPEFQYQWGLALERAGEFDHALLDYREGFGRAEAVGHRMMQAATAGASAYLHALHGRGVLARRWLDRVPAVGPTDWWSPAMLVQARLASALLRDVELEPPVGDPLEGVESNDAMRHWAAAFWVRTLAVGGPRPARLLRIELDSYLATLPAGQRADDVNADYLTLMRSMLPGRALGEADHGEQSREPTGLLPQLHQAVRAVYLARSGRASLALALAEPLLRVGEERPAVLLLALAASAVATDDRERRDGLLAEAVAVARAQRCFSPLTALDDDLRSAAARQLAASGEEAVAARLQQRRRLPSRPALLALTNRERDVAERAAAGESAAEIAAALFVSVNTVKTQLRHVYRKLGVSSRSELLRRHDDADGAAQS